MRFNYNTQADQKRLGAYSGNKSSFSTIATGVLGYFQPVTNTQRLSTLGIAGQGYEYTTDAYYDIQVNDILTIDGNDYGVRGIATFDSIGQKILRCTLELIING